ncbi:hypothetical protein [Nocardia bhagyanarayanae]|uniref:Uncharacterized protein n=1 Tax=Nocardia bhagyanarayanae TaxID=1215925 RepID=A0A543F4X5_9NOCA|nr:hypothetical protein [Nocardia bhagyanarayanae]TQM28861.1 hypothetical protein FB390_0437 [Nocardia bhagyanarayanae]
MDEEISDEAVVIPLNWRARRSHTHHAVPVHVDARAGGVTVSFQIRYVTGAEAERVADRQARAISALLRWLDNHDPAPTEPVDLDAITTDWQEAA